MWLKSYFVQYLLEVIGRGPPSPDEYDQVADDTQYIAILDQT